MTKMPPFPNMHKMYREYRAWMEKQPPFSQWDGYDWNPPSLSEDEQRRQNEELAYWQAVGPLRMTMAEHKEYLEWKRCQQKAERSND
jgi:hypothetical protein